MSERRLEMEVEVPGTPEQVWEAIATGPGITAWFVPAEIEEREGGAMAFDMGGGLESGGTVRVWEPPHRFVGAEDWPVAEGEAPITLASEWLVEALAGGTCIVRLVTTMSGTGDWSEELEQMREGWSMYFRVLKLYLAEFAGQPCSTILTMGQASGTVQEAWRAFAGALGVPEALAEGDRMSVGGAGAPPLGGTVDAHVGSAWHHSFMLTLDEPGPGFAFAGVHMWQGQAHTTIHVYQYGEEGRRVVVRDEAKWEAWMARHFPTADQGTGVDASTR